MTTRRDKFVDNIYKALKEGYVFIYNALINKVIYYLGIEKCIEIFIKHYYDAIRSRKFAKCDIVCDRISVEF